MHRLVRGTFPPFNSLACMVDPPKANAVPTHTGDKYSTYVGSSLVDPRYDTDSADVDVMRDYGERSLVRLQKGHDAVPPELLL